LIIAKLIGGLGNQLFQYAVARHLAEIQGTVLKIDLTEFEQYKLHKYSLQHFDIIEEIATSENLDYVGNIKEKHFHFDTEFKEISDDVLLRGYWQTEKYFSDISDIIREEFTVKSELKDKDLDVSQLIRCSNSVSLHIRRSDYTSNSYKDQIFDSLSLDYYERAIEGISKRENDLKFFIFSDSHEWVRDNVKLDFPVVYVDHNTADTNYEDLRLMSLCNHNIIANSSFSWWGAWLNPNPQKKVFAPKQWFNSNVRNLDPKDIIPLLWTQV
jgi:hypothetical protein